jgi:nucleoside-diphosphate-sugar epimerase
MTTTPSPPVPPQLIENEAQLDDLLTRPRPELVSFIRQVRSPLLILGAGGKMGPTLAALACRATAAAGHKLQVIAVSRFNNSASRQWLESRGVETIACDLFKRDEIARLPDAGDLLFLAGVKFGTSQNPSLTWATNTIIPTNVAERFAQTRMVALSTGNVYPLVSVADGGAVETHPLTPLGEYANAAVARERLFEFQSLRHGTPMVLVRLNYAVELRYGVLHDLAQKVWAGEAVDLANGHFNCIWQGDANDAIVRSLARAASPPLRLNLTGPEVLSVRDVASQLGEIMSKSARFNGTELGTAQLSKSTNACKLLGPPSTPLKEVLRWTAHWIMRGGVSLNKPTHFEARDGKY